MLSCSPRKILERNDLRARLPADRFVGVQRRASRSRPSGVI